MSTQDRTAPGEGEGIPASVRAQLLATEHWSLLASRSTTQSEVLTRISMFLMFTSASLVSLALIGQATRFSDMFLLLAALVLFVDVVIGLLTQIRVLNVAHEDLMYVLAMKAGLLTSLVGGAGIAIAAPVGVAFGLAFFAWSSVQGYRSYAAVWGQFTPVSPTPQETD